MIKKLLLVAILATTFIPTSFVSADPGPLDQYGGHVCDTECEEVWDLAYNEYHYHDIPVHPSYLTGESKKPLIGLLANPAKPTTTYPSTALVENVLVKNDALDVAYCMDAEIFASGLYDTMDRVRVAPVCVAFTPQVMETGFATLPKAEGTPQTKAYSFARDYARRAYFSDYIPLAELQGMMIQGITDTVTYTVATSDGKYVLKQISTTEKIDRMEQNKILLDDSVVYSYPIVK